MSTQTPFERWQEILASGNQVQADLFYKFNKRAIEDSRPITTSELEFDALAEKHGPTGASREMNRRASGFDDEAQLAADRERRLVAAERAREMIGVREPLPARPIITLAQFDQAWAADEAERAREAEYATARQNVAAAQRMIDTEKARTTDL